MAPALTGLGRVFINSSGVGGKYLYHSSMKVDGVSKSLGDVTPIYSPHPDQYDEFVEVATIKGADGRATSTLTGYLPIDTQSPLEELERNKCSFNLQVHYGSCTKPNSFNEFDSAIILRDVRLTSYDLSTLTARTPDERAVIDETAAISIGKMYRILPVKQQRLSVSFLPANAFAFGVANAANKSCGDDCGVRSNGCDTWIVGVVNANDAVAFAYTKNGGDTWSFTSANASALHNNVVQSANLVEHGGYIYFSVVQGTIAYFYRASVSSILNGSADTTQIATSQNGKYAFEITTSENYIWFVGQYNNAGWIMTYDTRTGISTQYQLNSPGLRSVSAYSDDQVILGAVTSGNIYYSNTHGVFQPLTTLPTTIATVTNLHMITSSVWVVATSIGFYISKDSGATWTSVLPAQNWARISFYDDIVGYANSTLGTWRTLDGGNTWQKIASDNTYQTNDMKVCNANPNIYFIAGGDGGGYLYKGNP